MKTIGYDRQHALRLVPFLRSILREVCERSTAIAQLEHRLERLTGPEKESSRYYDLKARLATHRHELRVTMDELTRLGCVLDAGQPLRVRIPDNNGKLSPGHSWVAEEEPACSKVSVSLTPM